MSGKFITLEGGEGCGKSTQAKLLADYLQSKGITPVLTKEPGGTPEGQILRQLLANRLLDSAIHLQIHMIVLYCFPIEKQFPIYLRHHLPRK